MARVPDSSESGEERKGVAEREADRFILTCSLSVVLGGLALYGLLAPIFMQNKGRHGMSCTSRMKQVSLGLLMYVQDYDERFPPATQWMDATYVYTKNENIYRCDVVMETDKNGYGYGFNRRLDRIQEKKIAAPDKTVMLFESWNLDKNVTDAVLTLVDPPRHGSAHNFAYADGHVKSVSKDQSPGIITP